MNPKRSRTKLALLLWLACSIAGCASTRRCPCESQCGTDEASTRQAAPCHGRVGHGGKALAGTGHSCRSAWTPHHAGGIVNLAGGPRKRAPTYRSA